MCILRNDVLKKAWIQLTQPKSGQALPEYALILTLVTLFCLTAVIALGQEIMTFLIDFGNHIIDVAIG